jgi:hypothetical protein
MRRVSTAAIQRLRDRNPDCFACARDNDGYGRMPAMHKLPVGLLCRMRATLLRRANQVHILACLGLAKEGRFAIVTNAGLRCGGRVGLQRDLTGHADEQIDATAKSCGPGIPTLMPSWRRCLRIAPATVANKPGHRGDHV